MRSRRGVRTVNRARPARTCARSCARGSPGIRRRSKNAASSSRMAAQSATEIRFCDSQSALMGLPRHRGDTMALTIGDTAPDFTAQTTEGEIHWHDWIGDSWAVLFSHPRDFTPVCTTELGYMAAIKPDFDARGVKIIAISTDPTDNHDKWAQDIAQFGGAPENPIIADIDHSI